MTAPPKPAGNLDKTTGGVKRKWWIIGGTGAALATVWYVRKQNASASATTTDPNIDPSTGVPYAEEYYTGATTDGGVGTSGVGGTVSTSPDPTLPPVDTTPPPVDTPPAPTPVPTPDPGQGTYASNAVWGQAAVAFLVTIGYDGATSQKAITKLLAGTPMSSDEASAAETAIAGIGSPPQPYPPLTIAPPTGQGTQPGQPTPPPTSSGPIPTITSVTMSPSKGKVGSKCTVTAVVQDNRAGSGPGKPAGTIVITFGAQTANVSAPSGSHSFDVGKATNGTSHAVHAHYEGNAAHQPSQSQSLTFTVTK